MCCGELESQRETERQRETEIASKRETERVRERDSQTEPDTVFNWPIGQLANWLIDLCAVCVRVCVMCCGAGTLVADG